MNASLKHVVAPDGPYHLPDELWLTVFSHLRVQAPEKLSEATRLSDRVNLNALAASSRVKFFHHLAEEELYHTLDTRDRPKQRVIKFVTALLKKRERAKYVRRVYFH